MKKALEILESNLKSLIMARNGYFEVIDYDQVEIEIIKTEEAIRELVIFKNRSCNNCIKENDPMISYSCKEKVYREPDILRRGSFCCNKWE